MSVAPAKPAAPAPAPNPELERVRDPFRLPKMRRAMHLLVPRKYGERVVEAYVTVTELKAGVQLVLDVDGDGIGVKSVQLSIPEANRLAEMLNEIRRRVVKRGEWVP